MRSLFISFVVALVAWPNYLAISLPGLPWITLSRLFVFPLVTIFLGYMSVSKTVRDDTRAVISDNIIIIRLLLAFVIIQLISIPFSGDPFDSFQKFLIDQVYWTAIFFLSCYLFRDPRFITRCAWILVALAVWLSLVGAWEWRLGRVPWAGHIPSFLQINDDAVLRTLAGTTRSGAVAHRVEATFAVSLGLGEYLALVTPLIIHFSLEGTSRFPRWSAALILPLVLFTTINSGARIGTVGFCASVILYGGLWAVRRWRIDRRSILGPAMTLGYPAIAAALLSITFISGRLRQIVWGGHNTDPSNQARIDQFHMGWPKVLSAPLGHGVGRGAQVLGYYNGDGVLTIDTYILRLALEYGMIGLFVYYLFFFSAVARGIPGALRATDESRKLLMPLSVSILVFLLGKSVYSSEYAHPIPFMMVGAICALLTGNSAPIPGGRAPFGRAIRNARIRSTNVLSNHD